MIIDSGDNLLRIEMNAKVVSNAESGSRVVFEGELAHKIYHRLVEFIKAQEDGQNKRTIKIG